MLMPHTRINWLIIFVCLAVTAWAVLIPISNNSAVPSTNDFNNHIASIYQAKLALNEGQFPLRVAPLEHQGYRYPLYQFYSPTSYTVAGSIYNWITPANPYQAFKLTIWLALIMGGIYMYRLILYLFHSHRIALLTSLLYISSPHFIYIIDHSGAFNEVLSLCVLPALIFYTLKSFADSNHLINCLCLALCWYVLITVHLITFALTVLFFLPFLMIASMREGFSKVKYAIVGFLFACMLAMWNLAPIVMLSKYLTIKDSFSSDIVYMLRLPLHLLLSPIPNKNVSFFYHLDRYVSDYQPAIGWPILIALLYCSYVLCRNVRMRSSQYAVPVLLALSYLCILFIWSPLNFWKVVPSSWLFFQFTRRFLGPLMWMGALLYAVSVYWYSRGHLSLKMFSALMLMLVISFTFWILPQPPMKILDTFHKTRLNIVQDVYLPSTNRYRMINGVENLDMSALVVMNILSLEQPVDVPVALFKSAYAPAIQLTGRVPANPAYQDARLYININGNDVEFYRIGNGKINWAIPLRPSLDRYHDLKFISVKFRLQNTSKTAIPFVGIENLMLSGFIDPNKMSLLAETEKFCHQQNNFTICDLSLSPSTQLIELPSLFYPDMLDVKLNGMPAHYYNVMDHQKLMTFIAGKPGKINHITIQFRGLLWANYVSDTAWGVWFILLVYCALLRIRGEQRDWKRNEI